MYIAGNAIDQGAQNEAIWSACWSKSNTNLIVTGGIDEKVKLYDADDFSLKGEYGHPLSVISGMHMNMAFCIFITDFTFVTQFIFITEPLITDFGTCMLYIICMYACMVQNNNLKKCTETYITKQNKR